MSEKIKNDNIEEFDEPCVFAVPCDMPFVVDPEKAKDFMEVKPNPELKRKNEEFLSKLNIKNEIEKGPVLRKINKFKR